MVRVTDPLVPRATFGVLNTLLYFPSGAVYPQQGFPAWMQAIADGRSVHVRGPRVQVPAPEEHGLRRDRLATSLYLIGLFGRGDDAGDVAVPENAVTSQGGRTTRRRAATPRRRDPPVRRARLQARHRPRRSAGDARANVAAVNYHFRDKMGLYRGSARSRHSPSCARRPNGRWPLERASQPRRS